MRNFDIEGCYPNMPKESIRFAMRAIRARFPDKEGVYVPRRSEHLPCTWATKQQKWQLIPFKTMLDVLDFCLDFTFIKMPDGTIKQQTEGIPMGDPLSPGMTIGTCAWMEQEWLQTLAAKDKNFFTAARFMDDILMVYATHDTWNHDEFLRDFTASTCYQAPLKLEPGKEGVFLETQYWVQDNTIYYKHKNDNETDANTIWRYQHWHSNASITQKVSTLNACLQKTQNAKTDQLHIKSALAKLEEFRRLRYPIHVLQRACARLGAVSGNGTWITVRNILNGYGPKAVRDSASL